VRCFSRRISSLLKVAGESLFRNKIPESCRIPEEKAFSHFASAASHWAGSPAAFAAAAAVVVAWALSGRVFGFSDVLQLTINTGTTINIFLIVFLIQRSSLAQRLVPANSSFALRSRNHTRPLAGQHNHLRRLHWSFGVSSGAGQFSP
jgi:hypothetical protein